MELKIKISRKFNRFERPKMVLIIAMGSLLAFMAFMSLPKSTTVPSPTVSVSMSLRGASITSTPSSLRSEDEARQQSKIAEDFRRQDGVLRMKADSPEDKSKPEIKTVEEIPRKDETVRLNDDSLEDKLKLESATKELMNMKEDNPSDSVKSIVVNEEATSSTQLEKKNEIKEIIQRKPLCELSDRRTDLCEMTGDTRINGNTSITFVATPQTEINSWRLKPYARKGDGIALEHVRELIVTSKNNVSTLCTRNHTVPALVFSIRGYAGNIFHDFTDIIIPLFLSAYQFDREVQFVISDMNVWWVRKYQQFIQTLSRYPIIDLDKVDNNEINCFPGAIVGLRCNKEFSIDIKKSPNGYSMVDFTKFLRTSLLLERDIPIRISEQSGTKKPRLLIIPRKRTRALLNVDEITRMAEELGFEVVVAEPRISSDIAELAGIVNSCDVMMGVHGAGLTNQVYLPTTAVLIQIVPWGGLEGISMLDFGNPAKDMKLNYLQYSIKADESTLIDKFPKDHPVIADPMRFHGKGWNLLRETFMDTQDVRLNLDRFRPVLKRALELLN